MQIHKRLFGGAGIAVLLLSVSGFAAAPVHATSEPSIEYNEAASDAYFADISKAEINLYSSDSPKSVFLDAQTGAVISVTGGQPEPSTQRVQSNCSGGVACWSGLGPALSYGFTGTVTNGNWTNRGAFSSKNNYALLCWKYTDSLFAPTHCTPSDEEMGKNTTIYWGYPVVGVRVTLAR